MAFIASQAALQKSFEALLVTAARQKLYLNNWITRLNSNITALDAVEFVSSIEQALTTMDAFAATPGMQSYAQSQFAQPGYDAAAEYTAMKNALLAVKNWIVANVPANSVSISNGALVGQSFAPAATAPLKSLVQTAANTIS